MFLIIPIIFILVSVLGIFYIFWKKTPYLRRLSSDPSSDSLGYSNFFESLFPGFFQFLGKIDLGEYKQLWMGEFEKFVRRLHIVSLRLDNFTNKLLHKIKTQNGSYQEKNGLGKIGRVINDESRDGIISVQENSLEVLKKEEQRLITEVAKDPKNFDFYKKLGELYIKMGSMKDAEESFEAALELNPQDLEIKTKLDKISKRLGL